LHKITKDIILSLSTVINHKLTCFTDNPKNVGFGRALTSGGLNVKSVITKPLGVEFYPGGIFYC